MGSSFSRALGILSQNVLFWQLPESVRQELQSASLIPGAIYHNLSAGGQLAILLLSDLANHPSQSIKFAWDESKHPRHAAGTAEGGQFAPKDMGVIAGEFNKVPPEMRVWQGKSHPMPEQKPSKLATGAFGERVASQVLSALKKAPFGSLNVTANNIAIDVIGDHLAVEVKTGLATNGLKAQQWRATIGEPGETEKALIKQMSPEEKRRANQFKEAKILERKREKLKTLSEMAGGRVEGKTVCLIVAPDLKAADVFIVDGFHLRLGWNKFATDEYYLGTFRAA